MSASVHDSFDAEDLALRIIEEKDDNELKRLQAGFDALAFMQKIEVVEWFLTYAREYKEAYEGTCSFIKELIELEGGLPEPDWQGLCSLLKELIEMEEV